MKDLQPGPLTNSHGGFRMAAPNGRDPLTTSRVVSWEGKQTTGGYKRVQKVKPDCRVGLWRILQSTQGTSGIRRTCCTHGQRHAAGRWGGERRGVDL